MIYELRTYTLMPGKQGEYLKLNGEIGRKNQYTTVPSRTCSARISSGEPAATIRTSARRVCQPSCPWRLAHSSTDSAAERC